MKITAFDPKENYNPKNQKELLFESVRLMGFDEEKKHHREPAEVKFYLTKNKVHCIIRIFYGHGVACGTGNCARYGQSKAKALAEALQEAGVSTDILVKEDHQIKEVLFAIGKFLSVPNQFLITTTP